MIMRKHILSNYSEKTKSGTNGFLVSGSTLETRVIEASDPDEFILGPTNITKSVENSDTDEFYLGPTVYTENGTETSDPDEFTLQTPIIKTSQTGDFCHEGDFDSILLI